MRPRTRRLAALGGALVLPWLGLGVAAALTDLPPELAGQVPYAASTRVLDREGRPMREVRADDGARARWVPLEELGERVAKAAIAAEDRRFASHVGIDPFAIVRAAAQDLAAGRIVSGASTITQQLARTVRPHPRTLAGKLGEMALAIRIEASLDKRRILEEYLNRASFGPGLVGVEAASRRWFDKPARDLSLAEATIVVGGARGPGRYDPAGARERDRVLDRMLAAGLASADEVARARAEPVALAPRPSGVAAPHFVRDLLAGTIDRGLPPGRLGEVRTTIDRDLQRAVEALTKATVRELEPRGVSAASVVVLENATGEVLAWVGAPDFDDARRLGQNDGVLAMRQPGSALKPFVYGLAVERLGWTGATVLPDVELSFDEEGGGSFRPRNYDGRYHGPVLLREALASSFNVPAAFTASRLGAGAVLDRLRAIGLDSLDEGAEHYGVAIALGDGEVRLVDLANAYATLARGGVLQPVRAAMEAKDALGRTVALTGEPPRRVMDERAAWLVTDILADDDARIASFGRRGALALPFPVAAKTGTSKGFRDNIAVGFTHEVTVAVWVGNFDGAPMNGVSGVTGAGPLFHDAMTAAMRDRSPEPLAPEGAFETADVCPLSGERPTAACPHHRRERFLRGQGPHAACAMHERVLVDPRNDLLAGAACAGAEERTFEVFPPPLAAWARAAQRPLAPTSASPFCPARPRPSSPGAVRITFPPDGARFSIDPAVRGPQTIRIGVEAPVGARAAVRIDGRRYALGESKAVAWSLSPGEHRLVPEAPGSPAGEPVDIVVE